MERIDTLSEFEAAQSGGPTSSPSLSLDSFATDVSGWKQRYDFLGGRRFFGYTSDVWLNGIQLYQEASTGFLAVSGETWPGSLFFAIPYRAAEPARINGMEVARGDAFVYFGGRDWHIRTPAAWSVITIALPARIFEGLPFIDELEQLARHGAVLQNFLASPTLDSIVRASALLRDENFSEAYELVGAQLELLISKSIAAALETALSRDPVNHRRYRAFATADNQIQALRRAALSAATSKEVLATFAKPSRRSLHNHVKTLFDCSPQQYVDAVKLNAIRRELSSGAGAVLDLAASYGMWHGGRLAGQYARLFSERPSETKAAPKKATKAVWRSRKNGPGQAPDSAPQVQEAPASSQFPNRRRTQRAFRSIRLCGDTER